MSPLPVASAEYWPLFQTGQLVLCTDPLVALVCKDQCSIRVINVGYILMLFRILHSIGIFQVLCEQKLLHIYLSDLPSPMSCLTIILSS